MPFQVETPGDHFLSGTCWTCGHPSQATQGQLALAHEGAPLFSPHRRRVTDAPLPFKPEGKTSFLEMESAYFIQPGILDKSFNISLSFPICEMELKNTHVIGRLCSTVPKMQTIQCSTPLYGVSAINNKNHHQHSINPFRIWCSREGFNAPLVSTTKWTFKSLPGRKPKHCQNDSMIFNRPKERYCTWKFN